MVDPWLEVLISNFWSIFLMGGMLDVERWYPALFFLLPLSLICIFLFGFEFELQLQLQLTGEMDTRI